MIEFSSLHTLLLVLLVAVGLAGLFYGGGWLTRGAVGVALVLRISKVIVGLTVVSIATSAPELVTSLLAGARGSPGLAIGNIVGSNIANIGLILGIAALIMPMHIEKRLIRVDTPLLIVITAVFFWFSVGGLERWEGVVLLVAMLIYLFFLVKQARSHPEEVDESVNDEMDEAPQSPLWAIAYVVGGALMLVVSANLLVDSSVEIARRLGVSDVVIGITVVAFGTSLPELAASVSAALHKHSDLAAGNIVGSNLFNLLLIGGALGTTFPVAIDPALFHWEYPAMLVTAVLMWIFFLTGSGIRRWEGGVLLATYIGIIGAACYWAIVG